MAELEPSEFLQNIRELGEKREREDEERVRRLEAQILQDKSDREARRAERARSISPQKKASPHTPRSPTSTPPSATLPRSPRSPTKMQEMSSASPTTGLGSQPLSTTSNDTTPDGSLQKSPFRQSSSMASPTSETPQPQTSSAAALGRSGTLTWNRRPNSGERNRPLSGLGRTTPSLRSPTKLSGDIQDNDQETEPSRSAIAKSLGSKDPSWFKQTADRGIGSAAYRRSQEDEASENSFVSGRRGLPGLSGGSRGSTAEPEAEATSPPTSGPSTSPSRSSSVRDSTWSNRFSSQTSQSGDSTVETKAPLPTTSAQKVEPPTAEQNTEDGGSPKRSSSIMSPTQGRLAVERPVSPTKGMGGFVQSAMMKRSDSVNKRWSAQAGGSLSRQNSTASNRSGYGGSNNSSLLEDRPATLSRGNSLEPSSRPTSSHSNISELTLKGDTGARDRDGFMKPSLPLHARGKSVSEANATDPVTSPPLSPSKRFSPAKSSWLESALNKPDSPKPSAPQQPSWMTELNKAKQQRASANLSDKKPSDNDIASFDALLHSRPGSPTKRQQGTSEPVTSSRTNSDDLDKPTPSPQAEQLASEEKSDTSPSKPLDEISEPKSSRVNDKPTPPPTKPKPADSPSFKKPSLTSPEIQAPSRAKPETPPKKDFRANLKPRQGSTDTGQKDEPEFKNVFGKLRKAETKNYVAPDELKSNILRGKAGLSITGGPERRERRDELKEDLLKQKEVMKKKAAEEGTSARKASVEKPPAEIPEALQRRNKLSRSGSSAGTLPGSSATSSPTKPRSADIGSDPSSNLENQSPGKPGSSASSELTGRLAGGSSKLASRFNPGLANVLARGPSPMSNGVSGARGNSTESAPDATPRGPIEGNDPGPSTPLTHMTKGRARGPKRRAPAAAPTDTKLEPSPKDIPIIAEKTTPDTKVPSEVPTAQLVKAEDVLPSSSTSTVNVATARTVPVADANSLISPRKPSEDGKPITPKKSPLGELVAAKARGDRIEDNISGPSSSRNVEAPSGSVSQARASVSMDQPKTLSSVKDFTSRWNRQDAESSSKTDRPPSPIKLPTKVDEETAMRDAGLMRNSVPSSAPVGLGLGGVKEIPSASITKGPESSRPAPQTKYPMSPPPSTDLSKTPRSTNVKPSTSSTKAPTPSGSRQSSTNIPPSSPIPDTTAATDTFTSFFGSCPQRSIDVDIDTTSILSNPPAKPIFKTQSINVHLLDPSSGKLSPLPQHAQHILHTGSLYLCTHTFTDPSTSSSKPTTETYFWIGDDVAPSSIDDSLIFARRKAKEDNNARLLQIRQNKEPASFLQALGGILIIRRGTRDLPANTSGCYMLCARRHQGHIVFDEVPLSRGNFCSGFTYVVVSPRRTFLWKGLGSSMEEYSTAKLTAMDLEGGNGDMLDVEEGKEPAEFHTVFRQVDDPVRNVARSAEHWRQKRRCEERYNVRLYKVEEEKARPSSSSSASGIAAAKVGSWMGSLSSSFVRRGSSQAEEEEDVGRRERSPSPVKQRPGTPRLGGANAAAEGKARVVEVSPFCQRDFVEAKEAVWVLDAFFEVYVILGPASHTHLQLLPTALLFAQDYSILAASLEDRPFVPIGNVLMPGFFPKDMRHVFRGWRDELTESFKEGRKEGKKVLSLGAAIAAVRR
ncbi:MAG: hypothetical protein M1820_005342 [Bogoriella megaspora]|nr:MAG: hypothetical protein M1820_005342 [Bogoriella megaspora]